MPPRAHSSAVTHWRGKASSPQRGFAGLGRHGSQSLEGSSHRTPVGHGGCPETWTSRAGAPGGSGAELPEGPSLHGRWAMESKNELRAEKPTQGRPETPKPAHRNLSPGGEVDLQSEGWGTSRQNGGQS